MKRWAWLGAVLLLSLAYLLNLGSLYAPTNGDEMVYLHIARLTSESGHWLPLVSDLQTPTGSEMRNTKPPLLFWQAMFAGQFGWDLFVLRLPYVLQTLLCAGLVGYLVFAVRQRAGRQPLSRTLAQPPQLALGGLTSEREWLEVAATPLLAAALYLGFFATYRYGRPVLPSSTESLFLFGLCALVIVWLIACKPHPAWLAAGAGLLLMPALLVKSFVLAAPVGLWLFAALWVASELKGHLLRFWHAAWPSGLAVLIGLAGFGLWFVVDPNPAAVWREFIIGENFSTKFSESRADSVLSIVLAPLLNAGLLAPLVLGLCWVAGKDVLEAIRRKASNPLIISAPAANHHTQLLLWLWIAAWLLVFAIPSQRSARYVIPVMPAVAVLLAMNAHRIGRIWWLLTLVLVAMATAGLGWIAYALALVVSYSPIYFAGIACVFVLCAVGLLMPRYRVMLTAICAVAWLALLGALAMPFDGAAGRFDATVAQQLAGQTVVVPQNFNAQFERYQFVLPTDPRVKATPDAQTTASFAVVTAKNSLTFAQSLDGQVLASRWVLRSRHNPNEVTWSALSSTQGMQQLLLDRELLVTR